MATSKAPIGKLIVPILGISAASGGIALVLNEIYTTVEDWLYAQPNSILTWSVPVVAGVVTGFGWWVLSKRNGLVTVPQALANHRALPVGLSTWNALFQTIIVACGASIGREGAPRLLSAAVADWWMTRAKSDETTRDMMVAAAAGAGLASVYNVPIAGVFYANAMLAITNVRAAIVTSVLSVLATFAAYPDHYGKPRYHVVFPNINRNDIIGAVVATALCLVVGYGFTKAVEWARQYGKAGNLDSMWLLGLAGGVIGLAAMALPTIRGNGVIFIQHLYDGTIPIAAIIIFIIGKPILTSMYLRAGVIGGLLTPSLSTGAAVGALVVYIANTYLSMPMHAVIVPTVGAAVMLGITMQAPIFAGIFMLELVNAPWVLWPVVLVCCWLAGGVPQKTHN